MDQPYIYFNDSKMHFLPHFHSSDIECVIQSMAHHDSVDSIFLV